MSAEHCRGADGLSVAGWRTRPAIAGAAVLAVVAGGCDRPTVTAPSGDGLTAAYAQARQEPNLKSLVVSRGGALVKAEYFNGGGPDNPEHVWSVTKSVLALTVGAALDAGCLASVDQTLGDLLAPVVTDPGKAAISLRHLLTMSSGIDFPETSFYATGPSLYDAWVRAPNQVEFVLARPMTAQPGERFEYGSGTIHLASVALTHACGTSTAEFAGDHLFAPLGIGPRPWLADRQGFTNGGAGLSLSPRDMQAIGTMALNEGRHEGRQVVSSGWVRAMTGSQISTPAGSATSSYGYGWWVGRTVTGHAYCLANGWGGQFIFVVPARQLVVTTAASTSGVTGQAALNQWQRIYHIVASQIIPAM